MVLEPLRATSIISIKMNDPLSVCLSASSSSPRASDLEQTRPQTSGEEELQLQLALAMSREVHTKIFLIISYYAFYYNLLHLYFLFI